MNQKKVNHLIASVSLLIFIAISLLILFGTLRIELTLKHSQHPWHSSACCTKSFLGDVEHLVVLFFKKELISCWNVNKDWFSISI